MTLAAKANSKASIVNEPVVFVVHPWDLVVTDAEVRLVPRPVPWLGMVVVSGLFTAFCGLMSLPILVWSDPADVQWVIPVFGLFAFVMSILFSSIIYWSYRFAQQQGPPFVIDRIAGVIHVPLHQLSVPLDQVDYLEVRNDMPDEQGNYRSEDHCSCELILVVRGEETPKRYLLVDGTAQDYYDPVAREIAAPARPGVTSQ